MELQRKISQQIESWYRNKKGALLIKGARQVGKTHIIRRTLKELGCQYVEINLIESPQAIGVLENSRNVNELIMGLSTITDSPIEKGKTVIFLDEIQKYKEMITKIKFLVDEGSFRYVLSGSLLGITITNIESAPVGYMKVLDMYPMDFREFLQISNISKDIFNHMEECFEERIPLMNAVHEKLLSLFNQYLVVGGMPQAVSRFAKNYNLSEVAEIHSDIINQYKLDYTQYEEVDKRLIISDIYDLIPAELLKQNRRFIVSDIKKGMHFDRVKSSFLWLKNAGVAIPVYNSTEPRIPLKINEKQSLFKLYLSDVGMLTSIYGMSAKNKIITGDKTLNGGGIYENAIVCELVNKGFKVYYYNSKRNGELDLVIEYKGKVLPIEIKSGKDYRVHSAISNCISNTDYGIDEAFVFANCNIEKNGNITYLPVYLATMLDENSKEPVVIERVVF